MEVDFGEEPACNPRDLKGPRESRCKIKREGTATDLAGSGLSAGWKGCWNEGIISDIRVLLERCAGSNPAKLSGKMAVNSTGSFTGRRPIQDDSEGGEKAG